MTDDNSPPNKEMEGAKSKKPAKNMKKAMVQKSWYCEKCGADVPEELVEKAAMGEVPKYKIKKCPSCKRETGVFDFKPTRENVKKFWEEWADATLPGSSKKNAKKGNFMKMTKEDAIRENKKLAKLRKEPRSMDEILEPQRKKLEKRPKTLKEVYKRVQKWLYLPDTLRIDVILAVAMTVKDKGEPLWVFFVGGSGDAKSELLRALEGLPYVRKIDQLTANTFASGKPNADDLGSELQDKDVLLLFSDLACLTSLNKDEKKKIWSQFRTLYDGEIYKDTGSGVKKKYDNCNVTILAGTTSQIKNEYHVHQQLGTRELLWDTEPDHRDNKTKMKKALDNRSKKTEMRQELKDALQGFLLGKKFDGDIPIPDDILEFIFKKCEKLRLLRAVGSSTDWRTGELDSDIEAEVTTRLVQQFSLLYKALKSIDPEYPEERYQQIIERFVKSSSQPVRYKLYEYFKKNLEWTTIYTLHLKLKNSKIAISSQLESLWNLGSLEKRYVEKRLGGYVYTDNNGIESSRGGRVEQVAEYCRIKTLEGQQNEIDEAFKVNSDIKKYSDDEIDEVGRYANRIKEEEGVIWTEGLSEKFGSDIIKYCLDKDFLVSVGKDGYAWMHRRGDYEKND